MAQVTCMKRGNFWQYRFEGAKIDGQRKRYTKGGFKTKKEAMEAGNRELAKYNNSGLRFVPSEISFSDYLDFWLKEYCYVNLKEITYEGYIKRIKNHIRPALGKYRLKSLTPAILQSFINQKFNEGYSRNTLNALKGILSGCMRYAVEPLGFIQTSPMVMVKLPSPRAKPKIPTRKKVRRTVEIDEWNKIITRFPYGHTCHIPLLLGYRCGLRRGEAFAITWEDIDFEKRTLSVNKQVQNINKKWTFCNPKYDSFRVIKLDDFLFETLKRAKEQQDRAYLYYNEFYTHLYENEEHQIVNEADETCKELHLINVRDNGTYIQPRVMQHCSRIIHYELGLMDFDFHSLRHTHTTMLIENGADIKDVQHRLGHKDVSITLQIYAHVTKNMQSRTIEILNMLPADGTGTSSLIEEYEKEADCTPSEIQKISLEAPRNPSVYAKNQGIVPFGGVQNCTPNIKWGYKRGTMSGIL